MGEHDRLLILNVEKSNAIFNLDELCKFTSKYIQDSGYFLMERKNESEGRNPKEKVIKWKATKWVTDYFQNTIKIAIKTNLSKVKNKKGKKLDKGDIKITIKGYLTKDWRGRWEGHAFLKFIRDFYNKYLIKERVGELRKDVKKETEELAHQIRNFLAMEKRGA